MRRLLAYWPVFVIFAFFFGFVMITVPSNLTRTILDGRVETAHQEVQQLTTSMTALLADAQADPRDLFLPDAFRKATTATMISDNLQRLDAATSVYTVAFHALLAHGNQAITVLAQSSKTAPLAGALNVEVVRKLGRKYVHPVEDPWGRPYCFKLPSTPKDLKTWVDAPSVPVLIWSSGADRVSASGTASCHDDIANSTRHEPWRRWYYRLSFQEKLKAAFL